MKTIKEIRAKQKLTQKEFAEKYHIPIRTIQKWERNGSVPPEYITEAIDRICFLEESELLFETYWENEKTASVRVLGQMVYITRYILHPVKQIFYKDEMTRYELGNILRDRCWDEKRHDLPVILAQIGLKEYNPYEICRITHGKMYQDHIWFRYPGELIDYEDVKRDRY